MSSASELAGKRLEPLRARLREHRLYDAVRTPDALRIFTEHHVVCVLDFMSLVKSLQRDLTCVDVPWAPRARPELGRFVHEIVLGEEFDVRRDGRIQSHFAWYLEAMDELGADSRPARELAALLAGGMSLAPALEASGVPKAARTFGLATARALELPLHVRAAVFLHGREHLIPEMFLPLVERLEDAGLECDGLKEYLERHIEIDGDDHGPLAARLLEELVITSTGDPEARRSEAEAAAYDALLERNALWDSVVADVTAATSV